jgi:putative hemolysin
MVWLATLAKPFVRLLAGSTRLVLRALGVKDDGAARVTEDEIRAVISEGADAGVIERHEHQMLKNVFRLDRRQIGSLMVPRGQIVYLDVLLPWEANLQRIIGSEHTRFPVAKGGLDDILGVIGARQLLAAALRGQQPNLREGLQPPVFIPESLTATELVKNIQERGVQLGFVIDEYGEVLGIVTLQDVLEAITGELPPEASEERSAVRREDGSWLLDGLIPIPELKDALGIRTAPEESRYHTLAGMLMVLLGRLPATGDKVQWEGWRLEIVDMDGKRVDKVLATPASL